MFSGIIEEFATVVAIEKDRENIDFTLTCSFVGELKIDQSVAHNGVCLTVVAINGNAGQCNYAAAKAGILGFTRSLAKELGSRNVRCNAVAPGFIETPMTQKLSPEARQHWMDQIPLHRGGTDQDVARVSLFLASELAEYVTGQVICCDGGLVL